MAIDSGSLIARKIARKGVRAAAQAFIDAAGVLNPDVLALVAQADKSGASVRVSPPKEGSAYTDDALWVRFDDGWSFMVLKDGRIMDFAPRAPAAKTAPAPDPFAG